MKDKTFTLSLIITLSLVSSLQAATVYTGMSGNCGPIVSGTGSATDPYVYSDSCTWSLNDQGKMVISGSGPMAPYTYNQNAPWYHVKDLIKDVTVGSEITSLASFTHSINLSKITFAEGSKLESMWANTFQNTPNLESIVIPEGVTQIPPKAFNNSGIESITLLSTSTSSIGYSAFQGASNLKSIVFPEGTSAISADTFNGCTSLESFVIPDSVTRIGSDAFAGVKLKDLMVNASNLEKYLNSGGAFESESNITINCTGTVNCQNVLDNWLKEKYGTDETSWPSWYGNITFNNKTKVKNTDGSYTIYELGHFIGYKGKRIYTVQEANQVSKPTGNRVSIRYK